MLIEVFALVSADENVFPLLPLLDELTLRIASVIDDIGHSLCVGQCPLEVRGGALQCSERQPTDCTAGAVSPF